MPATKVRPEPRVKTEPVKSWAGRIPRLRPGRFADGLPLGDVNYLSCKLVLRPNHFTSRKSLFKFADVMEEPAGEHGVSVSTKGFADAPFKIREVLFLDTPDFRLYNNSFILRRRIEYHDGFPLGDPEIVFKFRNADLQKAAETDVRPQIAGDHRVKFKCQALPLRDRLGGIRMLYSHNVQFPRSHAKSGDVLAMDEMVKIFPALETIRKDRNERLALVSDTIIEEVLQDIAELDFGHGSRATTNVAIWRTRGEHLPLIAEFSFQFKFEDREELAFGAMRRVEAFFTALQFAAKDWISLNATKTGVVYRMHGNPPQSHE